MRRLVSALLLLLVPVVAGCGSDPVDKANAGAVRAVVERFASSSDASACDLLTADALSNVYGGFSNNVGRAKANCRKRSAKFRGAPIKITKVIVINNMTARVAALSPDGKFTYGVTVRRPAKRWLIDQITVHKVRPE